MNNKIEGGVEASSKRSNYHSNRLVYIRYKDHVLFRSVDPRLFTRPNIRETMGWVFQENDEKIVLLWDKSVKKLPEENINVAQSGLVILKSNILERKEIG